jgi:N-acetylglutamate synthase-like GNAT family acetyltransferase
MYQVVCLSAVKTPLVNKFYAKYRVRGRAKTHDFIWVVYAQQHMVAACRLQPKEGFMFLSSVFVAPDFRHKGLAKKLLSTLLSQQSQTVYTFAYANVVELYNVLGFNQVLTYTPVLHALFDTYKHRNIIALQYPK